MKYLPFLFLIFILASANGDVPKFQTLLKIQADGIDIGTTSDLDQSPE